MRLWAISSGWRSVLLRRDDAGSLPIFLSDPRRKSARGRDEIAGASRPVRARRKCPQEPRPRTSARDWRRSQLGVSAPSGAQAAVRRRLAQPAWLRLRAPCQGPSPDQGRLQPVWAGSTWTMHHTRPLAPVRRPPCPARRERRLPCGLRLREGGKPVEAMHVRPEVRT
jgi:hypothetical protein